MKTNRIKNSPLLHILFVVVSLVILGFLFLAPEETTSKLPHDEIHQPFHEIASKKEAEKNCLQCHADEGEAPLTEDHPQKFRCLFCHKR